MKSKNGATQISLTKGHVIRIGHPPILARLLLLVIALMMGISTTVQAADNEIRGNVFADYDADGVDTGVTEHGIAGILVQAYDIDNDPIGSPVTTSTTGDYAILGLASGEEVRLELTIPNTMSYLQPGAAGNGSATTVLFATEGDENVNVGFNNPANYCQNNPIYTRTDNPGNFGKANGLGDIEAICDLAPLEIGNRVWLDSNRNGVQDANEAGIDGVTVQLFQNDILVGESTSSGGGEYYFGGNLNTGMVDNPLYPNTSYQIRISLAEDSLPNGAFPTLQDYNDNTANGNLHDNDGDNGTLNPGFTTVAFQTGGAGENRHFYDFGFATGIYDLSLIKTLATGQSATVAVGLPVNYVVTVKNQGTVDSGLFIVTDQIPAGMSFVSAGGSSWTCDADTGTTGSIDCSFGGSLAPNASTNLFLTLQIDDAAQRPFWNWAEISADGGALLSLTDQDSTPDTNTGDDFGPGMGLSPNDLVNNTNDIDYMGNDDEDDNDFEAIDALVNPPIATIDLQETVYRGQDSGTGCPGSELVTGTRGDLVTYCFAITNTGETYLDEIRLDDADLGITRADATLLSGIEPLAPTESLVFFYQTTFTGDLINRATTEGNPVAEDGTDLPGLTNPTAEDTAEVQGAGPAIQLEKTVYAGHDGGQSCPGRELVSDIQGTDITYCFIVTNPGDTYLDQVILTDTLLTIGNTDLTLVAGSEPLAPNASLVFAYETAITANLINSAEVRGNPTDSAGNDIPGLSDRTDSDTAEVRLVASTAGIELIKTVYLGHDGGHGCSGEELVNGSPGAEITYCFLVTNIGDTHLNNIIVDDEDLAVTQADMTLFIGNALLAPGSSGIYFYETTLAGNLINTAFASGNPTDADGNDLPDVPDPTDEDDAEVRVNLAAIGDFVWLDSNANGIQDLAELGLPGISVILFDENDQVVTQTITSNIGQYLFDNLEPGNYSIGFQLPSSSYAFSNQNVTTATDDTDNDADSITGRTELTLLTTGEIDLSWDAGIYGLPELTISKDANSTVVQPDGKLVYTIRYANTGIGQANNVIVTESIPLYTKFVPEESSPFLCANNSVEDGTVCTFHVGIIPAQNNGTAELVFVVVADTVIPENVRVIENVVTIDDGGPAGLNVDAINVQINRPTSSELIDEPGLSFDSKLFIPLVQ